MCLPVFRLRLLASDSGRWRFYNCVENDVWAIKAWLASKRPRNRAPSWAPAAAAANSAWYIYSCLYPPPGNRARPRYLTSARYHLTVPYCIHSPPLHYCLSTYITPLFFHACLDFLFIIYSIKTLTRTWTPSANANQIYHDKEGWFSWVFKSENEKLAELKCQSRKRPVTVDIFWTLWCRGEEGDISSWAHSAASCCIGLGLLGNENTRCVHLCRLSRPFVLDSFLGQHVNQLVRVSRDTFANFTLPILQWQRSRSW